MSRAKTASPSSPAGTTERPADPISLVGEELARFHNFAMACWAPEVHRDEDLHDVRSALAQLRSWEEDDPSDWRNPPHIVAAISLAICLRENVGLVLDRVPDVAPLWKPELDGIEHALDELVDEYHSGAEDYKSSLNSAWCLAHQAKRMCRRLEARVPSESGVPNGTLVGTQGDEENDDPPHSDEWRKEVLAGKEDELLSIEEAGGCIKMSERTVYRMMDDGMPYLQPKDKPKSHRRIWKSDVLAWREGKHPSHPKIK